MDNEMIDRVVKASFNCWKEDKPEKAHFTLDDLSTDEREFAIRHAKAIIKAMREPTKKMRTTITDDVVITDKCYYCGGHIDG